MCLFKIIQQALLAVTTRRTTTQLQQKYGIGQE